MRLPANESDKKSKEFVFQALRFIQSATQCAFILQVLESAILNLDNLDAFNPILDNLGRRHGKLESSVGFRSHYWSVFMECTIFHIRLALANSKTDSWGEAELDGVVTLWRHLVDGICDRIKAGYLVDLANRSNSKSARSSIALSAKSSPYYVDIPASHEMITGEHNMLNYAGCLPGSVNQI
uniref:Globin family profile domain-containing protein n=1 Tax=Ascaris lumbricoides TaxID=6252 RepID=A0A9J2PTH1_ASCLU